MKRVLGSALVVAACSSPAKPAPANASPTPADTSEATTTDADAGSLTATGPTAPAARPAGGIPMSCAATNEAGVCVPDVGFVKRLCNGSFPDVALLLFSKDAPFTRLYLKGEIDGWNAEGGASARAKLLSDEEVLALRRREAPKNGIVVGSGGGWLVMRWDGNCYTLEDNEVTPKKPSSPKHAALPFRFYGDRTKDALLENEKVLAAYKRRGKECKGATRGDVSKACEQADSALSAAIVGEVRAGKSSVPTPEKVP